MTQLASVRVELNQARDALEDCVCKEDFSQAAELKNRVNELEASKQSLLEESSISIREVRSEKVDLHQSLESDLDKHDTQG